ncbi:hypothetical protein MUK42_35081 [Musa troglodytarum]|uniref:Uncharacterized protein n=1 Tax=Musa troglodytarum TaxID=320322 RepID=A0A9E7EDD0_9LILI|nr:hypothetical protein MUK42_35081 [Musa troglodytarum]
MKTSMVYLFQMKKIILNFSCRGLVLITEVTTDAIQYKQ